MTNREAIKEIQERIDFHEKLYPDATPELEGGGRRMKFKAAEMEGEKNGD